MMVSKFRIFETPIACNPNKAEAIVRAECVLHNYCGKYDGSMSTPRTEEVMEARGILPDCPRDNHGRSETAAAKVRDRLCENVLHPANAIFAQISVCI